MSASSADTEEPAAASSRTFIAAHIIPADELAQEKCFMKDICRITEDHNLTIEWLARHGLLANSRQCCNRAMVLHTRQRIADGKVWQCKPCRKFRSIRHESFFANSKLTLPQLLQLIYWWAIDCKQCVAREEVGLATEAIVKWYNNYRDIACMYIIDHPTQIGGPGVEVEIDEPKSMHPGGRYHKDHKVLGLIERGLHNNCVLVTVTDNSASTLIPIIIQHCLPGTRVVMNGGKAYKRHHAVVNKNISFVDPSDDDTVPKGKRSHIKKKYRNKHRSSNNGLWDTYFTEFVFRRIFADNFLMNFIFWIRHYHPV